MGRMVEDRRNGRHSSPSLPSNSLQAALEEAAAFSFLKIQSKFAWACVSALKTRSKFDMMKWVAPTILKSTIFRYGGQRFGNILHLLMTIPTKVVSKIL